MEHPLYLVIDAINNNKKSINRWDRTILFKIGTNSFIAETKNGMASIEKGDSEKIDVVLEMSDDTFNKLMQKKITPLQAKTKGELKVRGSIIDTLKLANLWNNALKELEEKRKL